MSRSDLKIIVGRDSVARRTRAESALIRDILIHKDFKKSFDRLKTALCWFERLLCRDEQVKSRVDAFLRQLAKACLEQNRVDLFMQAWDHVYDAISLQTEDERLTHMALASFSIQGQRAYGENGQIAVEFALALLDRIGQTAPDMRDLSRLDTFAAAPADSELRKLPSVRTFVSTYRFVVASFTDPPDSDAFVSKAWLERLVERCSEPTIDNIILSLMSVTRMFSVPGAQTATAFILESELPRLVRQELMNRANGLHRYREGIKALHEAGIHKYPPPPLLLRGRMQAAAMPVMKRRTERLKHMYEQGVRLLQVFQEQRVAFASEAERMTGEIASRPRRGLRPNGLDHIEITLTPLVNCGILGLIFHPEGCAFPDVAIDVVFRKETPHLQLYHTTVSGLSRNPSGDLFDNDQHPELQETLYAMLGHVVTDVLYRIVTEQRPIREHPSRNGSADPAGRVAVRPYMRKLPAGHRASSAAVEAAKREMGYQPPQGMTFVQAFFRNDELEYDMPSEPFAIYGDEDLLAEIDCPA